MDHAKNRVLISKHNYSSNHLIFIIAFLAFLALPSLLSELASPHSTTPDLLVKAMKQALNHSDFLCNCDIPALLNTREFADVDIYLCFNIKGRYDK